MTRTPDDASSSPDESAPRTWRARLAAATSSPRLVSGLTVLATGGVGFLPLFGGPGYESALATGLIVPLFTVVSVAATVRDDEAQLSARERLGDGLRRGWLLGTLGYVVTMLHGLRAGFCSVREGTVMYVLGPFCGALVAGLWGAVWLELRVRGRISRKVAMALAIATPLSSALVALLMGYFTPIVFAFDPFAGFFSGTLYDTVIDSVPRLLTYRVGTLLTLVGAWLTAGLLDGERGRLRWAGSAAAFIASAGFVFGGSRLDHWHTAGTIQRDLGGHRVGQRCDVIHPTAMTAAAVDLLVRDCDTQLAEVAHTMGVASPPHVTAYFFSSPAEKRRLMGAADTYIAKPWRHEVYLQLSGYPHPILGHELAHVVASAYGKAPLHVAGSLRGFVPDPGLIEGMAVAASPDEDELSPEEWSRVMLTLGILPPLDSVFSLGFLGHASSRAYTVAGAFVSFVRAGYGNAVVGRWYGGEDLPKLTGKSWPALEQAFRDSLRGEPLSPAVLAIGKARFDRPAIFGRICPHVLDADRRDAFAKLAGNDPTRASWGLLSVLARDPHDASAELGLATCAERLGRVDESRTRLARLLADPKVGATVRLRTEERLGDLDYAAGNHAGARAHYRAAFDASVNEDARRNLEVKLLGLDDPAAHDAIGALLVGTPREGVETARAFEELGRWAAKNERSGMPAYLLAKNALARGDHARAADLFRRALDGEIGLPSVQREAARQRVIAGCALGDRSIVDEALRRFDTIAPEDTTKTNRGVRLHALASRCLGAPPTH